MRQQKYQPGWKQDKKWTIPILTNTTKVQKSRMGTAAADIIPQVICTVCIEFL